MFGYLATGQKGNPPQQFSQWLCNVYTGKAPFTKETLEDVDKYCVGVSMDSKDLVSNIGY